MKKLVSLLLALTLALALAIPASAAEDASIGIIGGADGPTSIFVTGALSDMSDEELDGQLAALQAQMRESAVSLLGGTPGQVNVLLGERCVTFTDAVPEIRGGRTMVPMRAALEAMGAVVEYDKATRTATVESGALRFTHAIGTDTILMGDGTQVKMDVASYIESGRTMVPVRFFSQVLGYDVFWDKDYRMVFLMDEESMVKDLDEHFTALNEYLAKAAKKFAPEQNYREDMTLSGTIKVVDSINGDRKYPFSMKAEALVGHGGMQMEMELNLDGLLSLIEGVAGETLPAEYRSMLKSLELEVINGEKMYIRCPLLAMLMAESGGMAVDADTWFAMPGVDYAELYDTLYSDISRYTVGRLCYAVMQQGDENRFFESWSAAGEFADMLIGLVGDETFTKSGSGYRWHLGFEELAELMNDIMGVEYYTVSDLREEGISECSLDMTISGSGSVKFSCVLAVDAGDEAAFRLECTMSGNDEKTAMQGRVQVRNVCDVTFDGALTVRTTTEKIAAAPTKGATVIELDG